MRFPLICHQPVSQQVWFQEASGLNGIEPKRFAIHPNYHVVIVLSSPTSILNTLSRAPLPVLLLQSHGFLPYCHRSLGCCSLELSTAITCRRHLHFHTVSYYYKYLDVTIVVASNVVARNRTLRSFTNDVHLFIFRAKFQGATRCVGSYTVHIMVDCHRLCPDWFIKVGSHKLLTRIKDSFGVKSLMFIVNNLESFKCWSRLGTKLTLIPIVLTSWLGKTRYVSRVLQVWPPFRVWDVSILSSNNKEEWGGTKRGINQSWTLQHPLRDVRTST